MTRAQLVEFIRIRNASALISDMQFQSDALSAGFRAEDLGPVTEHGWGLSWATPHGILKAEHGQLRLESPDDLVTDK
jgi:hypothetical protein